MSIYKLCSIMVPEWLVYNFPLHYLSNGDLDTTVDLETFSLFVKYQSIWI